MLAAELPECHSPPLNPVGRPFSPHLCWRIGIAADQRWHCAGVNHSLTGYSLYSKQGINDGPFIHAHPACPYRMVDVSARALIDSTRAASDALSSMYIGSPRKADSSGRNAMSRLSFTPASKVARSLSSLR